MLETRITPVDTVSMSEMTALATDQQELISVLAAYRAAEQAAPKPARSTPALEATPIPAQTSTVAGESAEADADDDAGWIPRLRELQGIAAERLSPLHGQLIAHGLLRFNLLGRAAGVGYRVTPEGRDVLARVGQATA
jgi:hypothetical protein